MRWHYLSEDIPQDLEQLEVTLLRNRNIEDAQTFFSPKKPMELTTTDVGINPKQLTKAVNRIKQAIKNQEKVIIFGDYDADGISATAILWHSLKATGIVAAPFIPKRDVHGYGVSQKALEEIIAAGKPELIITVDNGIVAHDALRFAKESGIDVILTDHHQPEKDENDQLVVPPALAVVHTTQLCGSTVAWMLARELAPEAAREQLDLAGLATIADQVPLVAANRSFAKYGVEALRKTKRVGLKALAEIASLDLSTLTSTSVGFSLAPRINAMGRLAHGLDALRLLCTGNWNTARKLARVLSSTNTDRQDLTLEHYQLAVSMVESQEDRSILIVASDEFHEGVIGLIAGRLVEQFHKPAVVLSIGETFAKGSARSVPGVNVVELLREVQDDLLEVGGHPMAAGLGISLDKLERVTDRLFTIASDGIKADLLEPKIDIDCVLPATLATTETVDELSKFEPYGSANPEPVFVIEECTVLAVQTIGRESQHLKLIIKLPKSNQKIDVLSWRAGEYAKDFSAGSTVAIAGQLQINEWKGRRKVQLVMLDWEVT